MVWRTGRSAGRDVASCRVWGAVLQPASSRPQSRTPARVRVFSNRYSLCLSDRVYEGEDVGGTDSIGYYEDDENKYQDAEYAVSTGL